MGAKIELENGYVNASTQGLHGADIDLNFPSVGATENLMMAASLASGETIIRNAAKEPEITDLANFLNSMGGSITRCRHGPYTYSRKARAYGDNLSSYRG